MSFIKAGRKKGIYLDVSSFPVKGDCFFLLLPMLQREGCRYLFINFGKYFPWAEDFHFGSMGYPEVMVQKLDEKSLETGITIVPVLSIFGENDFIITEKHYRHFAPGFPDNPEILPASVGLISLYGDMIEDIFSLLTHSPAVCMRIPASVSFHDCGTVRELVRIVSGRGKEPIFQNVPEHLCKDAALSTLSIEDSHHSGNQCWGKRRYSLRPAVSESADGADITEVVPLYGIFSCTGLSDTIVQILSGSGMPLPDGTESCTLLKDFHALITECWAAYRTVSEQLSLLFLKKDHSAVVTIFAEMKNFNRLYGMLREKADNITVNHTDIFKDDFVEVYLRSKTEPLEEALQRTALALKRIKRRLM